MKLTGIIEAIVPGGPNGPGFVIRCTLPGREGRYNVEINPSLGLGQPIPEWEFEVNPDGSAYLIGRAAIVRATVIPGGGKAS